MYKSAIKSTFFRSISVHSLEQGCVFPFFRSISVQSLGGFLIFPLHTRSLEMDVTVVSPLFRSIPVQSEVFFIYLRTILSTDTGTKMAGIVKDMSLIKQVLQLKQHGESNRGIARKLPINKETVNGYMQTVNANGWQIDDLLKVDDPELERMFHT